MRRCSDFRPGRGTTTRPQRPTPGGGKIEPSFLYPPFEIGSNNSVWSRKCRVIGDKYLHGGGFVGNARARRLYGPRRKGVGYQAVVVIVLHQQVAAIEYIGQQKRHVKAQGLLGIQRPNAQNNGVKRRELFPGSCLCLKQSNRTPQLLRALGTKSPAPM